ncbi:hypothetical protein V1512DRAFT_261119 [Lipomyces arxii]|uniref:uncharacterized protein n=1 Tax=Lipomyces arxii TaxID=56418 RepID=UPI0034CE0E65
MELNEKNDASLTEIRFDEPADFTPNTTPSLTPKTVSSGEEDDAIEDKMELDIDVIEKKRTMDSADAIEMESANAVESEKEIVQTFKREGIVFEVRSSATGIIQKLGEFAGPMWEWCLVHPLLATFIGLQILFALIPVCVFLASICAVTCTAIVVSLTGLLTFTLASFAILIGVLNVTFCMACIAWAGCAVWIIGFKTAGKVAIEYVLPMYTQLSKQRIQYERIHPKKMES